MKQAELMGKIVAAVRVRGRVNVRWDIAEALVRLNLKRVSNCTLLKVNDAYLGMLKKSANQIAYGEVDEPTLGKLVSKFKLNVDPKALISGKMDAAELSEMMPLRLHPPKHGYRASVRLNVKQGGAVGYMGKNINTLLNRMV